MSTITHRPTKGNGRPQLDPPRDVFCNDRDAARNNTSHHPRPGLLAIGPIGRAGIRVDFDDTT
ncbi:MAG: hypothetical protein AAFS10_14130 [Myxococcota bacterium]